MNKEKLTKSLLLSLFVLTSCAQVKIKDTKVCAVAGTIEAGANCAMTLSEIHPEESQMNFQEFIKFLEPSDEKAPAICQSARDWNSIKTSLEQACVMLKDSCSYEMKAAIRQFNKSLVRLK